MSRICSAALSFAVALTACQLQHPGQPAPEPASGAAGATPSLSTDQPLPKATQVEQLLEGRFAGIEVIRTRSGGFLIQVRGGSTLMGSKVPLYVINGLAVEVDPDRGLDWLSPAEIQNIEVLKDPAELAMYGGRAANGVIRITLKKPR